VTRMQRYSVARVLLSVAVLTACARASVSSTPSPVDASSSTLVVVVRHAEKALDPGNDPVLSPSGIARGAALDARLRGMTITDVVVSSLQRTRLTAALFIARSGAAVHVVPIGSTSVAAHVLAVADTVRAITAVTGHGVLVVGHSNTVTAIVEALGGPASRPLCDSQYSQLFILRGVAVGRMSLQREMYGAPDPVDASCAAMMNR
jgi:phosphohistidine phosphatase SixA